VGLAQMRVARYRTTIFFDSLPNPVGAF